MCGYKSRLVNMICVNSEERAFLLPQFGSGEKLLHKVTVEVGTFTAKNEETSSATMVCEKF